MKELQNSESCDISTLEVFYNLSKEISDEDISDKAYVKMFQDSLLCSRFKTMQVLIWICDQKNGLGNDKLFLKLLPEFLSTKLIRTRFKQKVIKALIRIGKWNLVIQALQLKTNSKLRMFIFNEIRRAINSGNINCARCMPRNGEVANRIRGFMKLSPSQWRSALVPLCSTQLNVMMSRNRWSEINYDTLPTHLLVANYLAFKRHDKDRFEEFLDADKQRAYKIKKLVNHPYVRKPKMSLGEVLALTYFEPRRK